MIPAPFMHALGSRDYGTGNVYEMRTYTYGPGDLPKVLAAWAQAVPAREELSPLANFSLVGSNKIWVEALYRGVCMASQASATTIANAVTVTTNFHRRHKKYTM